MRATVRLGDAAALLAMAWLTILTGAPGLGGAGGPTIMPLLVAIGVLSWSLGAIDAYGFGQKEAFDHHLRRVAAGFGLAAVLMAGLLAMTGVGAAVSGLARWFLLSFVALGALHSIWWINVRAWRRSGRLTPNIVVVGATANAERLIRRALESGDAAVLGVFDDRLDRAPADVAGVPVLGDTDALIGHHVMPSVDRVVIAVSSMARSRVRELIGRLAVMPNEIMLFVDHDSEAGRTAALSRIIDAPLARVSGEPGDERRAFVKRLQDLVIGAAALVVAAPIMVAVGLAVRLDSPGPILFRQRRLGFNNEPIVVWKFRSMRAGSDDARAARQVCAGDSRVTRVGRFIRATSFDELPQIINVLKGEMSLVGPRPHAVGMRTAGTESSKLVADYAHRHRMKPGVTGWAAINGSRGPVDTPEAVRRRVALDIEYIERQSFWFDLMIMVKTLPCLLGDAKVVR
ncbi:MAG TPA: exopolysaccharide biosynthesis polyprenyl glycosylphosphotransferase [Caulobacteraceae bacterium]